MGSQQSSAGYVPGKSISVRVIGLSEELGVCTVMDMQLGSQLLEQVLREYPAKPMSIVSLMTVSGQLQLDTSLREQGFQDNSLVTYVSSRVSHAQQRRLLWRIGRSKIHRLRFASFQDFLAHDIESRQIWNSIVCLTLASMPSSHLPDTHTRSDVFE